MNQFQREEILIGKENVEKLKKSKVIIYGIGGVGSFTTEALARAGVGHLVLVDNDSVDITNINRQIEATHKTIGRKKVDVMKERVLEINPGAKVDTFLPLELEDETNLIDKTYDYVVDAIDTIKNKVNIIQKANEKNISVISCTGAANKLDATAFEVSDIYKTSVCPVAKILRKELKKRNIKKLKVVYSKEEPKKIENTNTLGSISFVPSVAGLTIAGEVIKDIISK